MVSKKQILEVLNSIKKECTENECRDCAFYLNDHCVMQDPPENWELKENAEEEKWTPFRN